MTFGRCGFLASPDARTAAGGVGCRSSRPAFFHAVFAGVEKGWLLRPVPLTWPALSLGIW